MTFEVGDYVEIICHDGKQFAGLLADWTDQYVLVNGLGFPNDDIAAMHHG